MKGTAQDTFDRVVVIHNVGTTGDISKLMNEHTDLKIWRDYYDINVFVPAVLNAVVMNMFNDIAAIKKVVINITSLCAIHALRGCGYYCSAKAAREMYFKVCYIKYLFFFYVYCVQNRERNILL